VGIDLQPQADRTEVDRLLHQLRSTLARLKAELEVVRLDERPPGAGVWETLDDVFTDLGHVESAARHLTSSEVIVVDDDQRLASAMSRQLQTYGLRCQAVNNVDALATLLPSKAKLVIDLGALRLASRSSLERLSIHPMVVISGSSNPLAKEEARMYGARHFLVKPVDADHLMLILDSLS